MSAITKAALSGALKRLLQTKTLDDITIGELTQATGVSRKTFYYHFQDIYSLLEWTITEDGRVLLSELDLSRPWEEVLPHIIDHLDANRALIFNAYHSVSHSVVERELTALFQPILDCLLAREPGYEKLPQDDADFLRTLYTCGVVGIALHWIDQGMLLDSLPPLEKLQMLSRGTLRGFVEQSLGRTGM